MAHSQTAEQTHFKKTASTYEAIDTIQAGTATALNKKQKQWSISDGTAAMSSLAAALNATTNTSEESADEEHK